MLRPGLIVPVLISTMILTLSACNKADKDASKADAAPVTLQLSAEDILTIRNNSLSSGPVITGSVQPERKADLRAEVSSVVLQVLKENGEAVKRGDLLLRLDDTSIRDGVNSAEQAARTSAQSVDQSERQLQRLKTLRASGMATLQQMDDAELRRNNAQNDLVAAKARAVQARQQLQRTEVRAPFDGITSERKVSAGDTAQIGKELIKVIDPTSMQLQGLVSADRVGSLKVGQAVNFHVNGYSDQEFLGKIKRISPSANAATRQVEVLVEFNNSNQPRVSGLYAEGRVETSTAPALMVKESALVRDGDKSFVWQIKGGALHKQSLQMGERDARSGDFVVLSGIADDDQILRNPSQALKEAQRVQIALAPAAARAKVALITDVKTASQAATKETSQMAPKVASQAATTAAGK